MKTKPPNFRFVETIVCSRCVHSEWVGNRTSCLCRRHNDYFINVPDIFVCDDYQLERDEDAGN